MEAARTIVVVRHVIFARPQQFDRDTGRFRDVRRFHHVVVIEPTAERAAGAERVNRDVVLGYAERLRNQIAAAAGLLLVVQISSLPFLNRALQFLGSSGACEMKGYEYSASIVFAAFFDRRGDIAVVL